jgi:hypothetical protein
MSWNDAPLQAGAFLADRGGGPERALRPLGLVLGHMERRIPRG